MNVWIHTIVAGRDRTFREEGLHDGQVTPVHHEAEVAAEGVHVLLHEVGHVVGHVTSVVFQPAAGVTVHANQREFTKKYDKLRFLTAQRSKH